MMKVSRRASKFNDIIIAQNRIKWFLEKLKENMCHESYNKIIELENK